MSKYLGVMYVAKRPCGKVSASAWDDGFDNDMERQLTLGKWVQRGDTVERLKRYKDDNFPEFICSSDAKECECKTTINLGHK